MTLVIPLAFRNIASKQITGLNFQSRNKTHPLPFRVTCQNQTQGEKMFTQKKKDYYARVLGFKNTADFELFTKRFFFYLKKEPLTKNRIMSGFFILLNIQKHTLQNQHLINYDGIKNPHVKKYAKEILDLRTKGNGGQSIVKHLFENHRVKVSRGTIEKFYKQNGL